jgi:hypothetical protein
VLKAPTQQLPWLQVLAPQIIRWGLLNQKCTEIGQGAAFLYGAIQQALITMVAEDDRDRRG